MFAEFYAQSPLLFWPLVGLVIFLVSFAGAMLYVLIGLRDQRRVDYLASLPLEPDSPQTPESREGDPAEGRA